MQQQAERVVIGMDPHKRSATIEVMGGDESVLGGGRFDTSEAGCAAMVGYVNAIQPDPRERVWAVEGCNGIGHHIALRLLAGGEQVLDVPPKLSARARVFATGQGRKTDATDAHSVALINRPLHIMATVQLRNPGIGRDYYGRRKSEGKSSMDAMRCLKRRLADIVYRELLDDAIARRVTTSGTGPGGHRGDDSDSSAAGSQPHTNSSDKPYPKPVKNHPRTLFAAAS